MNAPLDILGAIAADPNVSPALRAALKPEGFGQYDNYVISNRLGQRVSVVFAPSAEEALRRYGFGAAPEGYSARIERYGCPVDAALRERVAADWGRLD